MTATFTTAAPLACIAWTRCARSAGMPLKSCADTTTRLASRSSNRPRHEAAHSTSTNSAPASSAPISNEARSSSDPRKCPPSHFARQVTSTGTRRPARTPGGSGSRAVSRRTSTMSASRAASRARRRSSVVSPVTVVHTSGRDNLRSPAKKKGLCNLSAEEALISAVAIRALRRVREPPQRGS